MNDKLAEQLANIAERLGFETARIWPQIVMVTWITSLFWLIVNPILITISLVLAVRVFRFVRAVDGDDEVLWMTFGCILVAILVGFAMMLLAGYPDYIAGVLFPEARTVLKLAGK